MQLFLLLLLMLFKWAYTVIMHTCTSNQHTHTHAHIPLLRSDLFWTRERQRKHITWNRRAHERPRLTLVKCVRDKARHSQLRPSELCVARSRLASGAAVTFTQGRSRANLLRTRSAVFHCFTAPAQMASLFVVAALHPLTDAVDVQGKPLLQLICATPK